jgi:hypothetical protein
VPTSIQSPPPCAIVQAAAADRNAAGMLRPERRIAHGSHGRYILRMRLFVRGPWRAALATICSPPDRFTKANDGSPAAYLGRKPGQDHALGRLLPRQVRISGDDVSTGDEAPWRRSVRSGIPIRLGIWVSTRATGSSQGESPQLIRHLRESSAASDDNSGRELGLSIRAA